MKSLIKKVVWLFLAGVFSMNVYAQKADDILALPTQKISIDEYENSYTSVINNGKMVLTCYINITENHNYYFSANLELKEDLAKKILADIHSYKADSEQMRTYFIDSNEVKRATNILMHQLKRERVLVVVKDKGNIVVVSYSPEFYKQHLSDK